MGGKDTGEFAKTIFSHDSARTDIYQQSAKELLKRTEVPVVKLRLSVMISLLVCRLPLPRCKHLALDAPPYLRSALPRRSCGGGTRHRTVSLCLSFSCRTRAPPPLPHRLWP